MTLPSIKSIITIKLECKQIECQRRKSYSLGRQNSRTMLTIMISIISCRQQLHCLLIRLKKLKKLDLLVIRITQAIGKLLMVDSKTSIRSQNSFDLQPSLLRRDHPSLIRLLIRRRGLHAKVLLLNNMMSTSKSHRSHQRRSSTSGLLPQRKAYHC